MSDPFVNAVADLGAALQSGEDLDLAISEIAAEHNLRPLALRNRGTLAFGDLATYRERTDAARQAIAQMTKDGLDYQLKTEKIAESALTRGYKLTAQDIRASDRFLGINPFEKTEK